MKKKLLSMLLVTSVITSILAGCGSSSDSGSPSAASSDEAAATASAQAATTASTEAATEAVAEDSDPQDIKTGGTLTIGTTQNPKVIGYTPEMTGNSINHFMRCAYESLTYYDADGNIIGVLATDWKTDPDEKTITFDLVAGAKFSDGTAFNAEAVKFNLDLYKEAGRSETNDIDFVQVVDDDTVQINLVDWDSSMLEEIGFFVYYMSPTAVEEKGADWLRQNSCGTGPFIVSDFQQGVSVSYTKNDNYRISGEPYLDGINFKIFADTTTLGNSFKANEIDVITYGGDVDLRNDLSGVSGEVEDINKNGLGAESVGLIPNSNDEKSPFYHADVRKAFCYAVDWDTIVNSLSYGKYERTNQWAVPGSVTYNTEVEGYPYNPEKAKELLKKAGYENGFDTTFYTMPSGFFQNAAQAAAAQLAEVGINANIEIVDAAKGGDLMSNGWDGIYWHFASIGPDLGLYMGRHLDTNGAYYAKGIQHPQDCLDLLQEIRTAKTEDEKIQLELQMQKKIYDEYCLFGEPLYVNTAVHLRYDHVKGAHFGEGSAIAWTPETAWLNK